MELTAEQKETVKKWASEGSGLSDIQKKLSSEFGITLTYMDVRFLAIDLGLQVKDKKQDKPVTAPAGAAAGGLADLGSAPPAGGAAGKLSLEVDRITKPGSLVSGTVRFSDGVTATWMLDDMGRLGLKASKPGYTPSQADVQLFQEELRRVLERQGF